MKRTVLLFVVCLFAIFSQAQGFQPEIKLHYDYGIDTYKNQSFGLEFIGGYRFNSYFRLGAGVGIDYVKLLYEDASITKIGNSYHYSSEYREDAPSIPVFLNAKVNFTDYKIAPFLNFNVGYNIFIPCSDYAKNNDLDLFVAPSFGVDFKLPNGNSAINLQVGYKYQARTFDLWSNTDGHYSLVTFAVGYQF